MADSWQQVKILDRVEIPLKLARTWSVYLTKMSNGCQSVIREATKLRKVDATSRDAPRATSDLETVMHPLRMSIIAILLKMVVYLHVV